MEVSAKSGHNVNELFKVLTQHLTQDDYNNNVEDKKLNPYSEGEVELNAKKFEETERKRSKKKCCSSN